MKNLLIKFYEYLIVLLHPSFWCQLYEKYPYLESFDGWCRNSLKQGCKFEVIDNYTIKFNGRILWLGNDKLCCFCLHENNKPKVSPSRYTKVLMWKELERQKRDKLEEWK